MSQRNTRKRESKTVRGYIVQVPDKRDASDEEDDEDEDNWLDYGQIKNAFTNGTFVKQPKKPRYCRVTVADLDQPRQTHTCHGRFTVLEPWWEVTVTIDSSNRAQGLTQYRVRADKEGIREQRLVPFLLNTAMQKCFGVKEAEALMTRLESFIRSRNRDHLLFEDVDPLLAQFSSANPDYRKLVTKLRYHDIVQGVVRGLKYPKLLSFLCQLFPLSFLSALLTPLESSLPALQQAADTQPWVFGFRAIMASRFKVFGLEANHRSFELCGLMERIPQVQRDALYVYEVLKMDAARHGHTYISFSDLRKHRRWGEIQYTVQEWVPALAFLAGNGVTVEERFDSARNIFLQHHWKSEVDIASGLKAVMERAIQAQKPSWDVDFASDDLSTLKGDSDQWSAAQRVVGGPVCIMSGKGGCGKTTVVTHILKHVCQQTPAGEDPACADVNLQSLLTDAELHEIGGETMSSQEHSHSTHPLHPPPHPPPPSSQQPSSSSSSSSQQHPPAVSPEQVQQMVERASQAVRQSQESEFQSHQGPPHPSSQERQRRGQLKVDLTTDLIKYLATTGDTALSRTPQGRTILLTAPTGKAARLLGHKANMESCTLHRVIYSYRAFVKQQKQLEREQEKLREQEKGERGGNDSEGEFEKCDAAAAAETAAVVGSPRKNSSSKRSCSDVRTQKRGCQDTTSQKSSRDEKTTRIGDTNNTQREDSSQDTNTQKGQDVQTQRNRDTNTQKSEEANTQSSQDTNTQMSGDTMTQSSSKSNTNSQDDAQMTDNDQPEDTDNDEEEEEEAVTWKYAKTEVLVVDECSLVSLRTFATLLNILVENTPLKKIVLLGDVRQLPSIEPGNFLGDVFSVFRERGLGVELRTNHRAESALIVQNATRISQNQLPVIDAGQNFHFIAIEDSEHCGDPERDEAVRKLLNQPELSSHIASQFVAFRRMDCEAINELCCQHYNRHSTKEATGAGGGKQPLDFRVGDKVCFRKNGQVVNQGSRLKKYLAQFPEILQAFGISTKDKKEEKSKKKDASSKNVSMDVTAAVDEIFRDDIGDRSSENDFSSQAEGRFRSRQDFHQSSKHENHLPKNSTDGLQMATSSKYNSNDSRREQTVTIKQEKDTLNAGNCSHQQSVNIKQEKLWGDENVLSTGSSSNNSNHHHHQQNVTIKQEKPLSDDSALKTGSGGADYHVQMTDFGLTMVQRDAGSLHDSTMDSSAAPSSSQDQDDEEEERAGKLKNGEVRLCNGEVFFIMDDVTEIEGVEGDGVGGGKEWRFLTLSDRDADCPRVVCVSLGALKRECRLSHSWARTIHTYQGSESDTVVYYVGDSKAQNWKHVYTAITRGRKSVLMVGKGSQLRQAVQSREWPRRSRLARRLKDMLRDLSFEELHAMMRTVNDQARQAVPPTTPLPSNPTPAPLMSTNTSRVSASHRHQTAIHPFRLHTTTITTTTTTTTTLTHSTQTHHQSAQTLSSSTTTTTTITSPPSPLDAFFDSDDSWLRDMSPVWDAAYQGSNPGFVAPDCQSSQCNSASVGQYTPVGRMSRDTHGTGCHKPTQSNTPENSMSDTPHSTGCHKPAQSNTPESSMSDAVTAAADETDGFEFDSPDLFDEVIDWDSPPTEWQQQRQQQKEQRLQGDSTPKKRQPAVEEDCEEVDSGLTVQEGVKIKTTPKKKQRCDHDPVDSIVTPIRRNLNI